MNAAATAYADQANAAKQEARKVADLMAGYLNGQRLPRTPDALTAVVARHDLAIVFGAGLACPHVDLSRPAARYAVGWYPGRITCGACVWQLDSPVEVEHCCDHCGVDVPGSLELIVAQLGATVLTAGLCPACMGGAG